MFLEDVGDHHSTQIPFPFFNFFLLHEKDSGEVAHCLFHSFEFSVLNWLILKAIEHSLPYYLTHIFVENK